jgi:hypothetical protein
MQSDSNYPHLLAARRDLHLVDVTCSGATTANILNTSLNGAGPQIEAVDADTKLVTVTVGGNDISYLGNLWAESCQRAPDRVPEAWKPYICKITPPSAINRAIGDLPGNMKNVVAAIRSRSPDAEIVFVNYIDIFSKKSNCSIRAPLSVEEIETAQRLGEILLKITARVTVEEHVKLVSAEALSKGHDVCSADSWLFDYRFPATPHDYGPIAYHPTLAAMKAIAAEIDKTLR